MCGSLDSDAARQDAATIGDEVPGVAESTTESGIDSITVLGHDDDTVAAFGELIEAIFGGVGQTHTAAEYEARNAFADKASDISEREVGPVQDDPAIRTYLEAQGIPPAFVTSLIALGPQDSTPFVAGLIAGLNIDELTVNLHEPVR